MQKNGNQQTNTSIEGKLGTGLYIFAIMELVVCFALPFVLQLVHADVYYNGYSHGMLAAALFGITACSSVIRRKITTKPAHPFREETVGAPAKAPVPATTVNRTAPAKKEPVAQRQRITLNDVAGYSSTKAAMAFVVKCLKNKDELSRIGSKIPAGILLYGPPGTGKTLMAQAIAGSAGVPFFTVNASAFINKYVGTGPAAIRDLYEKARAKAPSVVFIDELDAIGGARSGGDNEEYRSTVNALLSELDGVNASSGVLTIAATNRIEDLDQALIRPGRFDRKIAVPLPNMSDRRAILAVHARKKPLGEDVDLDQLASDTEGYSGAALATMLNEAGIIAVSRGSKEIWREDIDKAMFRSATGGEEVITQNENDLRITAWHEAGHALCMKLLCDRNVPRITIIGSTGGTNGITYSTGKQQSNTISKKAMENMIKAVYGGRAAEEILFGNPDDVTASASGDIRQATAMIRDYITTYGMGSGLLNISVLTGNDTPPSEYIEEANALAERLYEETVEFLSKNKKTLEAIAKELLKRRSLSDEELTVVIYESAARR